MAFFQLVYGFVLNCLYISIRRLDCDFIQHILTYIHEYNIFNIFLFFKRQRLKKILKLAFALRSFFQPVVFEHSFQGFTKVGKEDKAEGEKFNGRPPVKLGPYNAAPLAHRCTRNKPVPSSGDYKETVPNYDSKWGGKENSHENLQSRATLA